LKYHPELEGRQKPRTTAPARVSAKSAITDENNPALKGWKARGCTAVVKDGSLAITGTSATPFLGFAAGKTVGPAVMQLRVRSAEGGNGRVEWLPSGVASNSRDAKSVPFTLKAGGWQAVRVDIPAAGPLGIVRVYLPAQKKSVEIDWMELNAGGNARRWEFNAE
jgi:hypothetical protein